jgi:large subunit ribosomal protein L21
MDYAIIKVGGKQHRVRDGETLVVDRVRADEGGSFEPDVLLGEDGVTVTVKVLAHERGPKIRIGKYRKRTGYKRHNGFRAATSRIEVTIGDGSKRAKPKAKAAPVEEALATTEVLDEVVEVEAVVETAEPESADVVEVETVAETAESESAEVVEEETPAGLPEGYVEMTVAQIAESATEWEHHEIQAALGYEHANAGRKGAISALESAAGLPDGYTAMTVAEIGKSAKDWDRAEVEAALAHEQENAARKGAISALESALASEEEDA